MHTLPANVRDDQTGKSVARKLRATGRIPAVVYAQGAESTSIVVDPNELTEIFRKTGDRNTVVHLELDGATLPTLVKTAQRHPVKRDILHVDFYKLSPGQVVEVMVPLKGVGRAKGMAIGGRLRMVRREVKIRCEWSKIPATIGHDITALEIGDIVHASELVMPEGVELVIKNDFIVMSLYGKRAPTTPAEAS